MTRFLFALLLSASLPLAARADTDLVGHTTLQYGVSFPQRPLSDYVDSGRAYRVELFGGAKMNAVRWLSAVGLGLDFTFSHFDTHNLGAGSYYHRYQWDIFRVPVGLGWFLFKPGFSWVVTHTKMTRFGIDETSIRPALLLDLGLRVPLAGPLALAVDGRYEWVVSDREPSRTTADTINLTGSFWTALAGVQLSFD